MFWLSTSYLFHSKEVTCYQITHHLRQKSAVVLFGYTTDAVRNIETRWIPMQKRRDTHGERTAANQLVMLDIDWKEGRPNKWSPDFWKVFWRSSEESARDAHRTNPGWIGLPFCSQSFSTRANIRSDTGRRCFTVSCCTFAAYTLPTPVAEPAWPAWSGNPTIQIMPRVVTSPAHNKHVLRKFIGRPLKR